MDNDEYIQNQEQYEEEYEEGMTSAEFHAQQLEQEEQESLPSNIIDVPVARKNINAFLHSSIDISRTLKFLVDYIDLSQKQNDKQHQEIVDIILTKNIRRQKNGSTKTTK